MASAVRCPKSASKIAASASRRPVRRPRCRSASDAIDDDRDGAEIEPEQPLDGGGDRGPDLGRQRPERVARPGDDPQADEDAVVDDADAHGRSGQPAPPGRAAVTDAGDARDLEGRGPTSSAMTPVPTVSSGPLMSPPPRSPAGTPASRALSAASASAMSSGTCAAAVRAATSQANPIIRRLARPWVMMTVPFTPSNGEPPCVS